MVDRFLDYNSEGSFMERGNGQVQIYVKPPEAADDLALPITSQSPNGKHATVELSCGIFVMAVYLAPKL
ncbi:hypothetical protein MRX96_040856 [Rhipicephalus microplus]